MSREIFLTWDEWILQPSQKTTQKVTEEKNGEMMHYGWQTIKWPTNYAEICRYRCIGNTFWWNSVFSYSLLVFRSDILSDGRQGMLPGWAGLVSSQLFPLAQDKMQFNPYDQWTSNIYFRSLAFKKWVCKSCPIHLMPFTSKRNLPQSMAQQISQNYHIRFDRYERLYAFIWNFSAEKECN